jgi:polysaccharide pyruvyl transferase WcaK-like protein
VNLLAPFGFYGWGNIGDEATLQGFARVVAQARPEYSVWVGSRNPTHTASVEPSFRYFHAEERSWRRWWAEQRTSAVVVAGGTPIMDCHGEWPLCELVPLVEEASHRRKPVVFVGSGTEQLQREESRRVVTARLAPKVRYWSVRSEPDKARLIEYGVSPERVAVAADMAWLLEPVSPDWGRQQLHAWGVPPTDRLVGVNLVNQKPIPARYPHLLETVASFLDDLVEQHDASILFLANDAKELSGFDRAASLRTLAAMRHRCRTFLVPNQYWAPQDMMSLVANCAMTISMRYHFCLFSALQEVPFIALQRSDKVSDLCWDLRWPYGCELDGLDSQRLAQLADALEEQRAAAIGQLSLRRHLLHDRARANVAALETLQHE